MTAFLKLDQCASCRRETPWEWIPVVLLGGKPLAGTGVWRSALLDGVCARCCQSIAAEQLRKRQELELRDKFAHIVGGSRPGRTLTFDRFQSTPGNSEALELAKRFDCARENLYFSGGCGVGKTHLALAIAREAFWQGRAVAVTTPWQIVRKLRMKPPEAEQREIDQFVNLDVLVLDDFGNGCDTPFARQVLQEILDGRHSADRGGMVVTARFSLPVLKRRMLDPAIPSRLADMCRTAELRGPDRRQSFCTEAPRQPPGP